MYHTSTPSVFQGLLQTALVLQRSEDNSCKIDIVCHSLYDTLKAFEIDIHAA